jgi:uncharacterized protein
MFKFLLLVALIAVAIWLYRKSNGSRPASPPQPPPDPENMVICGHCGIRFPASESSLDADIHYCCDEHRRAGPR